MDCDGYTDAGVTEVDCDAPDKAHELLRVWDCGVARISRHPSLKERTSSACLRHTPLPFNRAVSATSGLPRNCWLCLPSAASPRRSRSRPRHCLTHSLAVTCSAAVEPAVARRLPSPYPRSARWTVPGCAAPPVTHERWCWYPPGNWPTRSPTPSPRWLLLSGNGSPRCMAALDRVGRWPPCVVGSTSSSPAQGGWRICSTRATCASTPSRSRYWMRPTTWPTSDSCL